MKIKHRFTMSANINTSSSSQINKNESSSSSSSSSSSCNLGRKFDCKKYLSPTPCVLVFNSTWNQDNRKNFEVAKNALIKKGMIDPSSPYKIQINDKEKSISFLHSPDEVKHIMGEACRLHHGYTFVNAYEVSTRRCREDGEEDFAISSKSKEGLSNQKYDLISDAIAFNKIAKTAPVRIDSKKQYTPDTILTELLKEHRGVIIGESHNQEAPKAALMDKMAELKKAGVEVLFIEHLTYDTMADQLKEVAEKKTDFPLQISNRLDSLDYGFRIVDRSHGFKALLKKAQEHGIQVIPIDTAASRLCGWDQKDGIVDQETRLAAMNFVAQGIMKDWESKSKGKWVALMGACHATTNGKVKGMSELLGAPAVIVENDSKIKESQLNRRHRFADDYNQTPAPFCLRLPAQVYQDNYKNAVKEKKSAQKELLASSNYRACFSSSDSDLSDSNHTLFTDDESSSSDDDFLDNDNSQLNSSELRTRMLHATRELKLHPFRGPAR